MTILLIEDDVVILEYEAQILRRPGHTVRATRNGDEAAKYYDQHRYDLVLTDLWHPGPEGHNLIKRILKKNPRQVVGVISASDVMEEQIDVPMMQKPFGPSDLLAFLDAIFAPRLLSKSKRDLGRVCGGTDWVVPAFDGKARTRRKLVNSACVGG